MTTTMTGPAYDLLVVRTVRDRILAGDWDQGPNRLGRCLIDHLAIVGLSPLPAIKEALGLSLPEVWKWNDTHTQAEVIALLDDVEDSLLGEMGVAG